MNHLLEDDQTHSDDTALFDVTGSRAHLPAPLQHVEAPHPESMPGPATLTQSSHYFLTPIGRPTNTGAQD